VRRAKVAIGDFLPVQVWWGILKNKPFLALPGIVIAGGVGTEVGCDGQRGRVKSDVTT